MINQANNPQGGGTNPAEQPMSPAQVKNAVDGALKMEREHATSPPGPKGDRSAMARTLEAHAERRKALAARIRAENPSYTDAEIEARLEQFGA
jgi:hypothetical protein